MKLSRGKQERGAVLVVALIMLAMVTFLVVAFVGFSRFERAAVEASMRATLSGGGGGGGSSGGAGGSSASARSSSPPSAAGDAPPALPPLPAPPFAIDPTTPLAANAHRLVEARLGRRLSAAELIAVDSALNEGLSLLQAGDAAARQRDRQHAEEEVGDEGDADGVGVLDEAALVGEDGARVHAVLQRVRHAGERRHRVRHQRELDR